MFSMMRPAIGVTGDFAARRAGGDDCGSGRQPNDRFGGAGEHGARATIRAIHLFAHEFVGELEMLSAGGANGFRHHLLRKFDNSRRQLSRANGVRAVS